VKRSTAIRHLVEMADVATEHMNRGRSSVDWPLAEMWVAGALLDPAAVDVPQHADRPILVGGERHRS
jgi:hypothetical protein